MKHIRKFDTVSAYTSAELDYPNMSYIVEDDSIRLVKTAPVPTPFDEQYLTFEALENGEFVWTGGEYGTTVSYSTDGGSTWSEEDSSFSVNVSSGDTVLIKCVEPGGDEVGKFSSTGAFNVYGNVMSLLYGDNFSGQTSLNDRENALMGLFANSPVVSAYNLILPATTLTVQCYKEMFKGCTSLVEAPELPATTLASNCYNAMFSGCTSLTGVGELPATELADACYYEMFKGCTSILTATEISATTLAGSCCERMFCDCTSLDTPPTELLATSDYGSCYKEMFKGCTSLEASPVISIDRIVSFEAFNGMFSGCTNLSSVTCLATYVYDSWECMNEWMDGVAASGTFYKSISMSQDWTDNGVPYDWNIEDYRG